MKIIDLRSDTITKPSNAMRQAIANAEVGDDVFGEDPTVNLLQEKVAKLFEKEAGLFVPSGVMANQIAIKSHTQGGDEVIVEYESHIIQYETAAPSILSSVQLMPVKGDYGIMQTHDVLNAIRPSAYYFPKTSLVCLENTHNRAGGTIYPIDLIKEISDAVHERGINLHLDGARIWNASVATGIPLYEYARYVDSISVCFSKGLGAPVGSMLLGDKEFITRAHRYRKIFGGGMRQAGILAAACLYAVDHNIDRLAEDHGNAKRFSELLSDCTAFTINHNLVQTNMVMLDFTRSLITPIEALEKIQNAGVLLIPGSSTALRAVTHLDVTRTDVEEAAMRIKEGLKNYSRRL